MFHVYTYGRESIQFLILTPKQAQTLNDFTECFIRSQKIFLEEHGYRWDPTTDPTIALYVPDDNPKLLERYDKVATFCNRQHAIRNRIFSLLRLDVSKEEFDENLVKRF